MLKVGWGKRSISPLNNTTLGGYRPVRESIGIHDDISVRTLLIEESTQSIILIIFDLVAVDDCFVSLLKKNLSNIIGIQSEVLVSTTHTHSAPTGTIDTSQGVLKGLEDVFGEWDEDYVDFLIQETVLAVHEMYANKSKASIKMNEIEVSNIAGYRNHKCKSNTTSLLAMEFENTNSEKILLWHFPCHPTVMNKMNQCISQDFPGAVEAELSEYEWVGFINGAAGDLSTRHTRRASSLQQLETFGFKIAQRIRQAVEVVSASTECSLMLEYHKFNFKTIAHPDNSNFLCLTEVKKIRDALNNQQLLGIETYSQLMKNLNNQETIAIEIILLKINEFKFFSFPGEVYKSLIEEKLRKTGIKILGYTNGYNLYLADEAAYTDGNYEAFSSPFMKGEGERFINLIENML